MRKFLFFALIAFGFVAFYYWYVRGEIVLIELERVSSLPPYEFATSIKFGDHDDDELVEEQLGVWEEAAPMLSARVDVAGAVIGKEIYVVGGRDSLAATLDVVEVFDIENNTWRKSTPMPVGVHHAMVEAVDGVLHVIGGLEGFKGTPVDRHFIYTPETAIWEEKAELPRALGAAGSLVMDGKIHIIGGDGPLGSDIVYYMYDPVEDSWEKNAEMYVARDSLAVDAIDGKIYAAGGKSGGLLFNTSRFDSYSQRQLQWTRETPLSTPRSGAAGVAHDGVFYVIGGTGQTTTYTEVEAFDVKTQSWSIVSDMPAGRHGFAAVSAEGKIFIMGGGPRPGLSVTNLNEVFTP